MLRNAITKVLQASLDVARITKRELEKEVVALVKKRKIDPKVAKQLLKEAYGEFKSESKRLQSFALKELDREIKKTKQIFAKARKSSSKKAKRRKRK